MSSNKNETAARGCNPAVSVPVVVLSRKAYRIYSNKRRSAYLIFRATSAALIRGRRLFEGGAYLKFGRRKESNRNETSTVTKRRFF